MTSSRFQWLMLPALALLLLVVPPATRAEQMIAFTANQDFLSRIYLLRMDGSVIRHFEYSYYRFVDTEVVDGELYVAEAFAPRVYRVDVATGDLDVVIDDWSLYYFYGLAWDGTFFYVDEWDLNRYDIDGEFDSRASFDETVYGSTYDGQYLWTLDDEHPVRCWDISQWPVITEVPENAFPPPSADCRGLWFDGTCFWSAESKDAPGHIYQFDYDGQVIRQWWEPAHSGWSACVVPDPASGAELETPPPERSWRLEVRGPNPTISRARFQFSLPMPAHVSLEILDPLGRLVAALVRGDLAAGTHRVEWRTAGTASGVYFLRLKTGQAVATRKLLLVN